MKWRRGRDSVKLIPPSSLFIDILLYKCFVCKKLQFPYFIHIFTLDGHHLGT
jgi:hypothetical protein